MGTIQHWQLIADGLLVISLLYLAIRFTQSSGVQLQMRSQELHKGLRLLVKEAERAGHQLNDTLIARQKELQSVLDEIQASEGAVGQFDSKIRAAKEELDSKLEAARKVVLSLEDAIGTLEQQAIELDTAIEAPPVRASAAQARETAQQQPVPPQRQPQQHAPLAASVERTAYAQTPEPPSFGQARQGAGQPQVNIYGEPIGQASAPQPSRTATPRLADSVEQQHSQNRSEPEAASMNSIYNAAEQLLRAGYDLQSVAAKTRLPLDEVRMLSQVVADEQENQPRINRSAAQAYAQPQADLEVERQSPIFAPDEVVTSREDTRLGVLGTMKRDRYTV